MKDIIHSARAGGELFPITDPTATRAMSAIDEKRIATYAELGTYYFSETNWKKFIGDPNDPDNYYGLNRAYVSRSRERGDYGMYALSESAEPIYNAWYDKEEWAERFAAEHPGETFREPYDNEYPLLDSIVQRNTDGQIFVPLVPTLPGHAVAYSVVLPLIKRLADMENDYYAGTEGLAYELSESGTYYICTGLGDVPESTDIELASFIDGIPVTHVAEYAFEGKTINGIRISRTITTLGTRAFSTATVNHVYIKDIAQWAGIAYGGIYSSPVKAATSVYINGSRKTALVIPESVSSIKARAFAYWSQLESVTLPQACTTIGSMAFQYLTGITELAIPKNVVSIDASAFGFCKALTSVTFEGTPTTIGAKAFEGCTALTDIYVPWSEGEVSDPNGDAWGSGATVWYDGQTKPEANGTVGLAYELSDDGTYYTLTGPGSMTGTELIIPDEVDGIPVEVIGYCAFLSVPLTKLVLGNRIKYVDTAVFNENGGIITSITLPVSLTGTGTDAFYMPGLEEVHYEGTLSQFMNINFNVGNGNPLSNQADLYICGELVENLVTPDDISTINGNAFTGCKRLRSLTVTENVESIEYCAFQSCHNLETVNLGESVKRIGSNAFSNCEALNSIILPNSINDLDFRAFEYSENISRIYCDWVEGEKPDIEAEQPWGATNAHIEYKTEG